MSRLNIGLGQAGRMCQMLHDERLRFLAEGLPIILSSAQGLWRGSLKLGREMRREAAVLEGFADEEAAKALILMDSVRCPRRLLDSCKLGEIVRWFYSHLARLIYAQSVGWQPGTVAELRTYVDAARKAHYLDPYAGPYILPNLSLYIREEQLYADVEAEESGDPSWSDPTTTLAPFAGTAAFGLPPAPLHLVEAMSNLGLFTPEGLRATSEIWGAVEFADRQDSADAAELTEALIDRLCREGLPGEEATRQHVGTLRDSWQLPMYSLDFHLDRVSKKELDAKRVLEHGWFL